MGVKCDKLFAAAAAAPAPLYRFILDAKHERKKKKNEDDLIGYVRLGPASPVQPGP